MITTHHPASRPGTLRPDIIQPETRAAVDDLYAGDTVTAFRTIDQACADPTESVREWELTDQQRQIYDAGFIVGYQLAAPTLHAEILELRVRLERAEHDADRYYAQMCRRPACPEPSASRSSYVKLSRIRGEHDRADRQGAAIDRMFPHWAGV